MITDERGERMKALGVIGCVLALWGIIWGIFFRDLVWVAVVGMAMMVPVLISEEE